jgi:hypothetical protein
MSRIRYPTFLLLYVSRRFNFLFKQFAFQNILLVQNRLDFPMEGTATDEDLQSSWQVKEAKKLGIFMENLENIIKQAPELARHCTSLCLSYKEVSVMCYLPRRSAQGGGEGGEDTNHEESDKSIIIPDPAWLNRMCGQLSHVTDLQLHCDPPRGSFTMPDFTSALSSFPSLAMLRVTGAVNYPSIFQQIATLPSTSALQTLDMSGAAAGRRIGQRNDTLQTVQMLRESREPPYIACNLRLTSDPSASSRNRTLYKTAHQFRYETRRARRVGCLA